MLGCIGLNCASDDSDAILGYFNNVLKSDIFALKLGHNILNIHSDLLADISQNFPIKLRIEIVLLIALTVGDSGH